MKVDTVVENGTVVSPTIGEIKTSVAMKDGKIAALGDALSFDAAERIDASGQYVFPGAIESHLHVGFLNPIEEDFASETASAVTGGITTVMPYWRLVRDMDPESNYVDALPRIRRAGEENSLIDFSFHFAFTTEGNLEQLDDYVDAGVGSFKFYLAYKDDEATFYRFVGEGPNDGLLYASMKRFAEIGDVVASIHAENPEIYKRCTREIKEQGGTDLHAWEASRPDYCEAENVLRSYYFGELTGARVYIVHLSSSLALDVVRRTKLRQGRIYAETCPQYLTHNVDSELGGMLRVTPPVRHKADNEALWEGLKDGTLDTVGSDHTYRSRASKQGNVWEAMSAFPGMATVVPVLLSEGYHKRGLSLQRIAQLTSYNHAQIFNVAPQKGDVLPGGDADLMIVDLDWERTVTPEILNSRADFSIYEGWKLKGWPRMTISRGQVVMRDGEVLGKPGAGRFIPQLARTSARAAVSVA
jgi:dihydropyrimidinase